MSNQKSEKEKKAKDENRKNIIAFLISFFGIALATGLLLCGKINPPVFAYLFTVVILTGFALYGFDRLKELNIKGLKVILSEAKEIKKDIYAKTETVKKLGEEVAELTAFNVARVGRFAPPDLQKKMLEARDKIRTILKEIGSDEERIKGICTQIEDMVLHDLKNKILESIRKALGSQTDRDGVLEKARQILENYTLDNNSRSSLVDFLKEHKLNVQEFVPLIERLEKFLKDKTL